MHKSGALIAAAFVAAVCAGCAGLFKPSDEQQVMNAVEQWLAGFNERDAETVVEVLSEDYDDERGLTRDSFGDLLPELDSYGVGKADMSQATVVIEGDTATAGPVSLDMGGEDVSLELLLKKEDDGVWRIVTIEGGD